ncbi:MAG: replication-associated recombination protein A [Campylobacterales bacterium]|nr:replication-associated recombination protein A [Campylobacterales bacterium]
MKNLAKSFRPNSFEEFAGQEHILSPNSKLFKLIKSKNIPHLFLWGRAGSGKTTLAYLIAKELDLPFYNLNATDLKVEELRQIFKNHKNSLQKPLIFIDEVHRLAKNQQEVLLPIMENHEAHIIGASTENPYYSLTQAIRSRAFLFEFKPLSKQALNNILDKVIEKESIKITDTAKEFLINSSNGDARAMLNLLEYSHDEDIITVESLKELREFSLSDGSSSSQSHYDLISALIKSIRGSDVDASIYYLAMLIKGGENPEFIARRLLILASEDIGNANFNALNLANSCYQAVSKIGYPESRIILAQCVVYLACSPKSNSSYLAINEALRAIENGLVLDIPKNITHDNTNYLYPHDYNGFVKQKYMQKDVKFYHSKKIGFEKTLDEWLEKIKILQNNRK